MKTLRNQNATTERRSFFRSNPVMNRLSKVNEVATDERAAGYGRIMIKTAYFLLVTIAGILAYLLMDSTLFANQPQTLRFSYKGFEATTSPMQIGFFAGAAILAIIAQLIAAFVRISVPVTGTIYSLCQGYVISFLVFTLIKGYEYLGLLALAITVVIVLVMSILYTTGVIRATKKFRTVILTLFIGMIGISILTFIASLIPLTRPYVTQIMGNFWFSLILTVLSIIIASLFLISDFAMIESVVENRMPAKYEWSAAFGLAFTVLWIYVKVLDLLIQIVGNNKNS